MSPALAADTSWPSSSRTTVEVSGFGSVALTILRAPSNGCEEPVELIWQGTIIFLRHVPRRSAPTSDAPEYLPDAGDFQLGSPYCRKRENLELSPFCGDFQCLSERVGK